jgi:histidinol-phosphatase (PHP family)
MTVNLHTHTCLCKHAKGTPLEYAAAADKRGIRVLGISDHTPLPDGRWPEIRMDLSQLDTYIEEIAQAQKAYPQMKILTAAECDYLPEYEDFYRNVLLKEKKLDYLIGSIHSYPYRGKMYGFWGGKKMDREALDSYADCYTQLIRSGIFLFGAHPDTFGAAIDGWNDDCAAVAERICAAAAEQGMPLEINTSGWWKADHTPGLPLPYPLKPFWQIAARHGVKVVVNADAHDPDEYYDYLERGYALAQDCGLEVVYPFGK